MQAFNAPKGRSESGIASQVSVPAGKKGAGLGLGASEAGDNPVKGGNGKGAIKGFTGSGVINGKIK